MKKYSMARFEGNIDVTNKPSRFTFIQDVTWLLLVVLVPLGLNLWGQQPFELPKVLLLRTLVWLLACLALAHALLARRSLWRDWLRNPMFGSVLLLAGVLVVTTATAVNWRLSLWGSYERGQGVVTLLTYLLLFLLAADQLRSLPRAKLVLKGVAITGFPLVLFGLAQAAGWQPFNLVSDARSPIFATLGRANFLGAYLAILLPLTLSQWLQASRRHERILWAALLVGELLLIGLTLARGAWLAAAVSLLIFALLWWRAKWTWYWRRLAWGGVGLLSLGGPVAVLWLGQQQSGSSSARLVIWQGVARLIGERPLLGYGADSLGLIFPRVYPAELVYYQGRDFFVDRAHNLFLDWGIIAGIPGLLAFLLLLALFGVALSRALRQPQPAEKRLLLCAVTAAVAANLVNNLVSFDVTPTAAATWLLLGLGVAFTLPESPSVVVTEKRPLWQWIVVGLLFVGWGTAVWQVNGRPLAADVAARQASQLTQARDVDRAVQAAAKVVALWPVEPAHQALLGQMWWRQAVAHPASDADSLAQAETAWQSALALRPEDALLWLQLAEFRFAARQQFGYGTLVLRDEAYQRALSLAPNNAVIYTAWGRAYLADGDVETAVALLRQAVQLDASSGEAYLHLGAAELALGRVEVALADYQEAVRLLPKAAEAYAGVAACYWQLGQAEAAREAASQALVLEPKNEWATAVYQAVSGMP